MTVQYQMIGGPFDGAYTELPAGVDSIQITITQTLDESTWDGEENQVVDVVQHADIPVRDGKAYWNEMVLQP